MAGGDQSLRIPPSAAAECRCSGGGCSCSNASPGGPSFEVDDAAPLPIGFSAYGFVSRGLRIIGNPLFALSKATPILELASGVQPLGVSIELRPIQDIIREALTADGLAGAVTDCPCEATMLAYDVERNERTATVNIKEMRCTQHLLGPALKLRVRIGMDVYSTKVTDHMVRIHISCAGGNGCPRIEKDLVAKRGETRGDRTYEGTYWWHLPHLNGIRQMDGSANFLTGALAVVAKLKAMLAHHQIDSWSMHPDQQASFCNSTFDLGSILNAFVTTTLGPPKIREFQPPTHHQDAGRGAAGASR